MNTVYNFARLLALIAMGIAAFWAMHLLFAWTEGQGDALQLPARLAVLALYALLIGVPFLPSFQVSMAFMILQGPEQVWWIYGATVTGFYIPFLAGWLIPPRFLIRMLHNCGLHKIAALVEDTYALPMGARLDLMREMAPNWIKPLVNKWRYAAFFVALNFPGNVVIGGAGGILLVAGMSRVFAPLAILGIICFCLSTIPIVVTVTGFDILEWLKGAG
ncbi:hypothetical protein [Yoonia sp. BS5-3]|uniref:TVP38/TMEM64 family membrane protein n=1 Tax=Yoonia phaeophyticola TaxID=3137369 RepID=A0ABZ2V9V9_9RHOB